VRSAPNVKVWQNQTKNGAVLGANDEQVITLAGGTLTLWVEGVVAAPASVQLVATTDRRWRGRGLGPGELLSVHQRRHRARWRGSRARATRRTRTMASSTSRRISTRWDTTSTCTMRTWSTAPAPDRRTTRWCAPSHSGDRHRLDLRLQPRRWLDVRPLRAPGEQRRVDRRLQPCPNTAYIDAIENDSDIDLDSERRLPVGNAVPPSTTTSGAIS
jgi:hypothetical protein